MRPGFFGAMLYPIRGLGYFLKRPALWKYAAVPLLINVALFIVFAVLFFKHRAELTEALLPERWWPWLRVGLGWLLTVVVAVVGLFLFSIVGNLLASPFLDAMTERILGELGETPPPGRGALRAFGRALVNQSLKLLIFGAIQALLLLLLVTPLGFLHPPLSGFLAVLFLGFEYVDYPLDARRLSVPERFAWLFRNLAPALGFGSLLLLVLAVPFLGYFCLPLSVAGASLLVHDCEPPSSKLSCILPMKDGRLR